MHRTDSNQDRRLEFHRTTTPKPTNMNAGSITINRHLTGAILLCLALLCGCSTTATDKNDPLYQTQLHVSEAMRTFREAKISGFITLSQRESIEAAHKEYETAYEKAQTTASEENIKAAQEAAEKFIRLVGQLP